MRAAIEFAKDYFEKKNMKQLKIAEIGVFEGDNAREMRMALNPERMYLIDIKDNFYRGEFTKPPYIFIRKYSQVAALDVPLDLDLVYIDGAHDEYNVLTDIVCWYPKIKGEGIICGHDYGTTWSGVEKAVKKMFTDFYSFKDVDWWLVKERTQRW